MDLLYTHWPACFIRGAVWVPFGVHFLAPFSLNETTPPTTLPPPQALSKYMSQPELCTQTAAVLYTQRSSVRAYALLGITSGFGVTVLVWTRHILISWPQQVTAPLVAGSFVCGNKCRPCRLLPNQMFSALRGEHSAASQCVNMQRRAGAGSQSKKLMGFLERWIWLTVFLGGAFDAHESAFRSCIIPKRGFPSFGGGLTTAKHPVTSAILPRCLNAEAVTHFPAWCFGVFSSDKKGLWCSG